MIKKKKKKEYKRVPDSVKLSAGIPGIISGEKTYRYEEEPIKGKHSMENHVDKKELAIQEKQEIKIELDIKEKQDININRDIIETQDITGYQGNIFQVNFDPDLEGELFPDSDSKIKCRVNFFSQKGTIAIYKIWQHHGGNGPTKMKILDGDTKKEIDGGWSEVNLFTVKKDELKGIFLIFYREETLFPPNDVDTVGVKIETSEGDYIRKFDIRWNL